MTSVAQNKELLSTISASVLVPADTKSSLNEVLQLYPDVEQRSALYFGMTPCLLAMSLLSYSFVD